MFIEWLILLAFIVFLIYKYFTWHFNDFKKIGLNGPPPKLVLGNFPSAVTGKQHLVYDIDDVYNRYKKTDSAVGVFMTRNPEILLLDPKLAHNVMVTNFSKYRDNTASKWIVDKTVDKYAALSPFFTEGDAWKSRRADVLGGVTANKLSLASPIWQGVAKKLREYLKQETAHGNAILETRNIASQFTINIVSDFLWGIDAGSFANDATATNTLLSMAQKMLQQSFEGVALYYQLNFVPFLKRYCNYRFFPEFTDKFFSQITKDAMAMRLKDAGAKGRGDFLNYCMQLQDKKELSHDEVMGQMLTVLLDAYETSATVAYHVLFYLAWNAEVQTRLRDEIAEALNGDEFMPYERMTALVFLDQCVHEALRMITPIPIYSRICTESTELELDGNKRVPIKAGTILTIPTFSYHHDGDYFAEPYKYNPERFDNVPHSELTKQGVFMPFGDGPRICLGMRMGLFEVKTFIVEILKAYRVKACAKTMKDKKPDAQSFIMGLDGEVWLEYERL